jgi:hypothetical protein
MQNSGKLFLLETFTLADDSKPSWHGPDSGETKF